MPHDIHKQRLYLVTWREPDTGAKAAYWRTRRATVACYSVKQAIAVIESHAPEAMISTVGDHGEIDYHTPFSGE